METSGTVAAPRNNVFQGQAAGAGQGADLGQDVIGGVGQGAHVDGAGDLVEVDSRPVDLAQADSPDEGDTMAEKAA
ncbi:MULTISPECIES: hypothetical protein [unclassified Streptomyces]|uniref:hypothetical protein n=1 Tax=Streptomyces sp. SID4948 TaxID=2690287 RepID=UPI001F35D103|nr:MULTISPECIES: hypothetical protein [unclassified Streptomyces]